MKLVSIGSDKRKMHHNGELNPFVWGLQVTYRVAIKAVAAIESFEEE